MNENTCKLLEEFKDKCEDWMDKMYEAGYEAGCAESKDLKQRLEEAVNSYGDEPLRRKANFSTPD